MSSPRRRVGFPVARAFALISLLSLVACGGGGSASTGGGLVVPDGFVGTLHMPNTDLGRANLAEPNDTVAQAFALPPFSSGSRIEAAGTLDSSGVFFGAVDPQDACRIACLRTQVIAVDLDWVGQNTGDITIEVMETATGTLIASERSATPAIRFQFLATAETAYDVLIQLTTGNIHFVVGFTAVGEPGEGAAPMLQGLQAKTALTPTPAAMAYAKDEPACTDGHVLVRFAPGADEEAICVGHGLQSRGQLASGTHRMHFPCAPENSRRREALDLCQRLRATEGVAFAEPDWIVTTQSIPNDPEFGRQWNMRAISAPAAWDITTGDPSVRIGIVDTGMLQDHPDLSGKVVAGYDFISDGGVAGDGDGRDPNWTDAGDRFLNSGLSSWHGTHVAGIAAAKGNDGYGVTGVAPDCSLVVLRALGLGGGLVSDVADAIRWGAGLFSTPDGYFLQTPLEVMNLSIGLDVDSTELRNACQDAHDEGVFLVGAAGNTGGSVLFPAAYDSVFCVAATSGELTHQRFIPTAYSCFGPEVDIAAPGGLRSEDAFGDGWPDGILSCVRRENVWPQVAGHLYLIGTSQATPHVAGAAALMRSLDPNLTTAQIADHLRLSALDINSVGVDAATGYGMLQVHGALQRVLEGLGTPSTAPARLVLPTHSLKFIGLQEVVTVPVINGGTGQLQITSAATDTDDGSPWLSATVLPTNLRTPPSINTEGIEIRVSRTGLANGRYSGTVRINDTAGGAPRDIRVTLYVGEFPRIGMDLQLVAFEADTAIARLATRVGAQMGYRFWCRGLPGTQYLLRSGEDLDGNGIFCQAPFEMCGWYGGAIEEDATLVDFEPGGAPQEGLDIDIVPQSGN